MSTEIRSDPPIVRPALARDAAVIAALLRRSIVDLCRADHGDHPERLREWLANKTEENIAIWIANADNFMVVAECGGEVAGVGCARRDGYVGLNYVAPQFRFCGVSKAILADLERWVAALRCERIWLESTVTARRFYLAAGYEDAGAMAAKHGLTIYPMTKTLGRKAEPPPTA